MSFNITYRVDGKDFKTPLGLQKYLAKKHGSPEVTGVSKERLLKVMAADRQSVVATYRVTDDVANNVSNFTLVTA